MLLRVARGMASLFLLAVLLVAGLWVSLQFSPVRKAILALVSDAIDDAVGFSIDADSIGLDLGHGAIGLDGLRLIARGAEHPFATVDEVDLRVRWSSLFGERVRIPSVAISGLRIDGNQDLPAMGPKSSDESDTGQDLGIDIARIEITSIEIVGPIPGDGDTWLRSWGLAEGSVTGSFVANRLHAEANSRVRIDAKWPGTEVDRLWTADLDVSLSSDLDKGFELARVSLLGEGMDLVVVGKGRFEPLELETSVEARIEPSRWWPAADDLGTLEIRGTTQFDSDQLLGDLTISAEALAGELLDPWLAEMGFGGMATAGTRIETDADLHLVVDLSGESFQADLLQGQVQAEWRRDEEILLAVDARADEPTSLDPEAAAQLTVAAVVRPEGPDVAEFSADLDLASWARWQDTELRNARARIEIADLDHFLVGLWVPPETIAPWLPAGRLSADAKLNGPVLSPFASAELQWTVGDELVLSATALHPAGNSANEFLSIEAELLPSLPGLREIDARFPLGKNDRPSTFTTDLELPDLPSLLDDIRGRWALLFPRSPVALAGLENVLVASLARGSVDAHLEADGSWKRPSIDLSVDWRPDDLQRGLLTARGDLAWKKPFLQRRASGELALHHFDLADWQWTDEDESEPLSGRLTGRLSLVLNEDGRVEGSTNLDLADFTLGEAPWLEEASLTANFTDDELTISAFSGRLAIPRPELERAHFDARGELAIAPELAGRLSLRLTTPAAPLSTSMADLVVADGVAKLQATVEGRPGEAVLEAPLGSLADLIGDRMPAAWSKGLSHGPIRASVDIATIDGWAALLLPVDSGLSLGGALHGEIDIDLSQPTAAKGEVVLEGFSILPAESDKLRAAEPVRLSINSGRLLLERLDLRGEHDGSLIASLEAELHQKWQIGDSWSDLVDQVKLDAQGKLDASILNPVLGGGLASGTMLVELDANNSSGDLILDLDLEAPDASLFFPAGYVTRIESPRFKLRAHEGGIELQDGEFVLNRGKVQLEGRYEREEGIALNAALDGVRYRVDHGLNLIVDGHLEFTKRPGRAGVISGRAGIDRGTLRRDIFLDREFLRAFTFDDAAGDPNSALDRTELDLVITTREGIQIKNNIADLRLDWGTLTVEGTLGEPLVAGRIDSDPGGWLEALGQLYRVDSLSIELFGDASVEPVIEVETTSLLDDPTLYQQRREGVWAAGMNADSPQNDLFWSEQQHSSEAAMAQFTSGLVTHFSDRLARTVGQGATMQFSVQPLPLYGETSSDSRVTLTQRLGRYVTFIASSDTRDAESVTYILETADLLPRTTIQLFTSDDKNEGGTAQIVQPLIRRRQVIDPIPRLGKIEWKLPDYIKERHLRRAMTFSKGDPFPEGSDFAVEIDMIEALQSLGFPGSTIRVTPRSTESERVELLISVNAGPHVEYSFEGLQIPLGFRETITAQYLPGEIDQGASLESVKEETEKTLRRLGHLRPTVTVTEESLDGQDFEENRSVRVVCSAERQIDLDEIRFEGLPEEDKLALAQDYDSSLSRIELAEALPNADRLLLRRAAALGYPNAKIGERHLSEQGNELVVTIEHGPRQRIASFEIVGLPADHRDLAETLSISPGDPARRHEITSQGRIIVAGLRKRGLMRANLDLSVTPTAQESELVDVVFKVTPGPRYELAGTDFRGLEHTKLSHVESLAEIEAGKPLQTVTVGEARRNLFRTTLFESIDTSLELEDGTRLADEENNDLDGSDDETRVVTAVFEVEEGPRYLVSYGGRWEDTKGSSVIGDLIDRNFRGIGQTLGLRAVYGESERRLRLYYSLPRKPFPSSTMEIFLEASKEDRSLEACDVPDDLQPDGCQAVKESGGNPPDTIQLSVDEISARFQLTFPLTSKTQARPYLELKNRNVTVIDGIDELSLQLTSSDKEEELDRAISPVLGVQIAHDTRHGSTTGGLSEGLYVGLQVSGTHEALGSDLTALEAISEVKIFKQLTTWRQKPVVWAQRYRLGSQLTSGEERIPVFDQYFAGGEYSLRGYPTESFGPGQLQIIINQELHFPVWALFTGLVFFDTGNVWDDLDTMRDDFELFGTVGVGLRFSAFRIDVGVPLNQRLNDPDYQFLFGFGNAF